MKLALDRMTATNPKEANILRDLKKIEGWPISMLLDKLKDNPGSYDYDQDDLEQFIAKFPAY